MNLQEGIFLLKKKIRKALPPSVLNLYFGFYPTFGYIFYGRPSRKIKVIGVTGTDGKSSTVLFIAKILKEAGYRVGYFSSIAYSEGDAELPNTMKMTMPGRFFMQKFIRSLVDNKCDFAVIEFTSEGVKQKRHECIDFDIAVITNIKPEHIESHGGFENYKRAKAEVFKRINLFHRKNILKTIVANVDDEEARKFTDFPADKKVSFGFDHPASLVGTVVSQNLFENVFSVTNGVEEVKIALPIGGPFIAPNALGACAVAHSLGVSLKKCAEGLEKIKIIPGRFEIVSKTPLVIVDYAHTVAAVEAVLSFIRKEWTGPIVHVFGAAGGGRDTWKRPLLAKLSERFADKSILTEENPFDEPNEAIIDEIYKSFENKEKVLVIPNRKEAVRDVLKMDQNTLFLFTGKGSETVIAGPKGKKIPYDERQTILWALNK